jgi:hypothetical protein
MFFRTVGIVLLLSSCTTQHELYRISDTVTERNDPSFLVVADPQIHNLYGNPLYQSLKIPDKIARIAIRPPELNILAPYSLTYLLKQGQLKNKNDQLTLMLGDGTNIACSGEFEIFKTAMDKGVNGKGLWLMVHGNHDSYLIGMVNSYQEKDLAKKTDYNTERRFWPPKSTGGWPIDESWWEKITAPTGRGWSNACVQPKGSGESSPMNKNRWLVKYRDHLEKYEIYLDSKNQTSQISTDKSGNKYYDQIITTKAGTQFEGHKYFVKGKIYLPIGNEEFVEGQSFSKTYKSYFVQAYDLDENNRIILIDTSVCGLFRGGISYIKNNAGSRGCIG